MQTVNTTPVFHTSIWNNKGWIHSLTPFSFKSKEIEKWASGLRRIHEECLEYGVKVEFNVLKTGFMAVFYRREKEGAEWESRDKIDSKAGEPTAGETKEAANMKTGYWQVISDTR